MKLLNDTAAIANYLQKFGLTEYLDTKISAQLRLFEAEKDEMLLYGNRSPEYFYFLVEGKLKVFMTLENGKSLLIRFSNPLSLIGDVELYDAQATSCNVQCVNNCRLLAIESQLLREYGRHAPHFLEFMLRQLSFKLQTFCRTASLNQLYPLEQKLAGYLLSINSGQAPECSEIHSDKYSEISMLLGASYRHLARVINSFVKQGLVKKERGGLRLLDLARLQELSGGNIYE